LFDFERAIDSIRALENVPKERKKDSTVPILLRLHQDKLINSINQMRWSQFQQRLTVREGRGRRDRKFLGLGALIAEPTPTSIIITSPIFSSATFEEMLEIAQTLTLSGLS
jgi:hypothetical protein